jgi:hypothetical protein
MAYSPSSLSIILAFGFSALGCDGGGRVDNRLDCKQICDRYAECFDDDFDVAECKSDCRDSANDDADFEDKVDACSDCLDGDQSCAKDTLSCSTDCVGIIP